MWNPIFEPKTIDRVEQENENTLDSPNDLDLPKGVRNCTKQALYPFTKLCFSG